MFVKFFSNYKIIKHISLILILGNYLSSGREMIVDGICL